MFVHTARQNYEGFTKKEVKKAVLARKAPGLIGPPSKRDLKYLVRINLDDYPVKILAVDNARGNVLALF